MNNNQIFWLWVIGFPALGLVLGLAGLKLRALRYVLAGAAPVFSVGLYVYGLFRGGPNECVDAPGPPGYICHPTPFLSSIGWYGVIVVTVVTVVSLAPLVAAWTRRRAPAVLGTVVLTGLIVFYIYGLLDWVPAAAAMLAAAIAGPPNRLERGAPAGAATAGDTAT